MTTTTPTALGHYPAAKRNFYGDLVFENGTVIWEVTKLGNLMMTDAAGHIAILDIPFEVTANGAVLVFVDGGETHVVFNGTETVVGR